MYRQNTVAKLFLLVGCRDDLQRGQVPNVPNDQLVCVVQSEDKWAALKHVEVHDWASVALQATKMSVTEEVLRPPDIGVDLVAYGDQDPSEVLHVAHVAHSSHVLAAESAEGLAVFEVVEHDGPVKAARCDAQGA